MSAGPKRPGGKIDDVRFQDTTEVSISTERVPPNFPCPTCKGESKASGIKGWRVCCNLRLYVGLTESELLAMMDDLAGAKARVQQFEIMYKKTDAELTEAYRIMRERGLI